MKYIGNIPEQNIIHTTADRYDYVYASNPTIDVNTSVTYATWLNSITGELFVCTDNTTDFNVWMGQFGTIIRDYHFPTASIYSSTAMSSFTYLDNITFDGSNMIVLDYDLHRVNFHSGLTNTISTYFFMNHQNTKGLAVANGNLIIVESDTDNVDVHVGLTSSVSYSFSHPDTLPCALAWDGTNLLSAGYSSKLFYKHDGLSSTILDSFTAPGTNLDAMVWDGVNLISCDSGTDLIYIHDGFSDTILDSFAAPNTFISGLFINNDKRLCCCQRTTDPALYVMKKDNDI